MATKPSEVDIKRDQSKATPATRGEEMAWPFGNLRQEINQLFDEFDPWSWRWPMQHRGFSKGSLTGARPALAPTPPMDLVENDGGYEIMAELPGMDPEDVEIKLHQGYLTIHGEKEEKTEKQEENYHLCERSYGTFQRSFRIPAGVDMDKIDADFSKGVLHVRLPKSHEAKESERKIKVKAA